jgi:hypothetical protein
MGETARKVKGRLKVIHTRSHSTFTNAVAFSIAPVFLHKNRDATIRTVASLCKDFTCLAIFWADVLAALQPPETQPPRVAIMARLATGTSIFAP